MHFFSREMSRNTFYTRACVLYILYPSISVFCVCMSEYIGVLEHPLLKLKVDLVRIGGGKHMRIAILFRHSIDNHPHV